LVSTFKNLEQMRGNKISPGWHEITPAGKLLN
jgi:hypothetical protein